MKIGLLGTRGIPNRYGGFEEFAEKVSTLWAEAGHEVYVYCEDIEVKAPLEIPNVFQIYIGGSKISGIGQFIYDTLCTRDAINRDFDIVYHAGYATSVIGNLFYRKRLTGRLIYNMDGLEWKRSKFSGLTKAITRKLESIAAKSGAVLVADNKGIKNYLDITYGVNSNLIEYGALIPEKNLEVNLELKYKYPREFDLVIARFEPENHIEEIIRSYEKAQKTLVLVANQGTSLYTKLESFLSTSQYIVFNGPIYDKNELEHLKRTCRYYIHGHSVGGTNPSLLEAMASGCLVLAHRNDFNSDVLGGHGFLWSNETELKDLIVKDLLRSNDDVLFQIDYCKRRFDWSKIAQQHLFVFETMLKK